MSALEPKKTGPVQLAELPGRPGYSVEFEVEPEPEHHEECGCEQCAACIPEAEFRAEEERREWHEEQRREGPTWAREDLGVHGRAW